LLEIYGVALHGYVLKGNHFHVLVQTPKGNLSEFMRHFNIAYTGAYNRRHKRVGHLYQGRYKAILVEGDIYLLELSRYLHLNPIRIKPLQRERLCRAMEGIEKVPLEQFERLPEGDCTGILGQLRRGARPGRRVAEPLPMKVIEAVGPDEVLKKVSRELRNYWGSGRRDETIERS
jgi:hypothetical protein